MTDGLERLALRFDQPDASRSVFRSACSAHLRSAADVDGLNEGLREFLGFQFGPTTIR